MLFNNYNYNLKIEESYVLFSFIKNLTEKNKNELFSVKFTNKMIVSKSKINNIISILLKKFIYINQKKIYWLETCYFKKEENNIYLKFNKDIFSILDKEFINFIKNINFNYILLSNLKIYEFLNKNKKHIFTIKDLKTIDNSFIYLNKYNEEKENIIKKINRLKFIEKNYKNIIQPKIIGFFSWNIKKLKFINENLLKIKFKERIEEREKELKFINKLLKELEKEKDIVYYISLFNEAKKYFKNELNLKLKYKIDIVYKNSTYQEVIIAKLKEPRVIKKREGFKDLLKNDDLIEKIRKNKIYLFEIEKELS